ncbi:MAG TPA: response regulator transcription factor [Ferruginibacter sp.]|nr:response regulator transcription factor [Ferruginibacter sp.]
MKKFLLIDDHEVVRSGIRVLLSEIYKPSVIDEAPNGELALEKLQNSGYDLAILDIQIPHTDTFDLMEFLRIKYPSLKVLIFSMSSENIYAKRFLKAGARGFISKSASLEEIKKAIKVVLNNHKYISDSMIDMLAEGNGNNDSNPFNTLSTREFEIATLLLNGVTISKIAASLQLRVSTIGTHKSRIFEKLSVTNLLEMKELANIYNL